MFLVGRSTTKNEVHDDENEFLPTIEKVISSHEKGVHTICFSPNQTLLCSAGADKKIFITDLRNYENHKVLSSDTYIYGSSFSPDGNLVAIASNEENVQIFKMDHVKDEPIVEFKDHSGCVRCCKFYHQNDPIKIVSGSNDSTLRVWDIELRAQILNLNVQSATWTVDVLPDNNTIITGDTDSKTKIWDERNGKCVKTLEYHKGLVRSVHYHQNTHLLATGSWDRTIKITDFRTFKVLHEYCEHANYIRSVCFHPSGKFLVSGAYDRKINIYDIPEQKVVYSLEEKHEGDIRSVQFSPDGKFFASGSMDKKIKIWNFPLGKLMVTGEDLDEEERLNCLVEKMYDVIEEREEANFCVESRSSVLEITVDTFTVLSSYKFLM